MRRDAHCCSGGDGVGSGSGSGHVTSSLWAPRLACVRKNSPQYMFRNSSHSCHYRRYRTYRSVDNVYELRKCIIGGQRIRDTPGIFDRV
ncbi:hypothetical protein ANN_23379 [Periplaneta americana]|uniref:Uncharacterized protein n=1 Tax=Periplaneta americana TaxID=6978 RepID=A0ABQ8SLC8_PERAM|nr:hypothetical protein ANN_23379 [Periplaneta americana]